MSVRIVPSKFLHRKLFPVPSQSYVVLLQVRNISTLKFFIVVPKHHVPFIKFHSTLSKIDTSQPFAYYEILGIKRDAKQSEVKQAYFKLAKIYHPDVNNEDDARETFDKITEAYTTLIDLTQRYFYDHHGVACEELRKRGSNSTIFDWVPKYSIYENQTRADGETTEVEDWFKAQGHQGFDAKRRSLRQIMKDAYVEFRYGLSYYDFPWEWKAFVGGLIAWIVFLYVTMETLNFGYRSVSYRKPTPIYLKWENDDIYDILWYVGARKNKSDASRPGMTFPTNSKGRRPKSEMERAGMYHMPKRAKQTSEYSHTIYSNTRSRTKSKNLERHKLRQKEMKEKLKEKKTSQPAKKKISDGFSV